MNFFALNLRIKSLLQIDTGDKMLEVFNMYVCTM